MSGVILSLSDARQAARVAFARYGGQFVEPAILQPAHTYLELAGEQMRGRLVVIANAGGGEEFCLRPDLTVAAALVKLGNNDSAPGAILYDGPAFRQPLTVSERPIEFLQTGREWFGGVDALADDAEAVRVAVEACQSCGISDLRFVFSDAGLPMALAQAAGLTGADAIRGAMTLRRPTVSVARGVSKSALGAVLSSLSPEAAEEAVREILSITGADPIGGRSPKDIAERLVARGQPQASISEKLQEAAREVFGLSGEPELAVSKIEAFAKGAGISLSKWGDAWRQRLAKLKGDGLPLDRARFDAGRDFRFGYYDGFVFELINDRLGEQFAVGGGGRYDGLFSKLSGGRVQLSGVGSMVRVDRLSQVSGAKV